MTVSNAFYPIKGRGVVLVSEGSVNDEDLSIRSVIINECAYQVKGVERMSSCMTPSKAFAILIDAEDKLKFARGTEVFVE
jgi:hypothetical protein